MKKSNFDFLLEKYPDLAKLVMDAEQALYNDPNTSIIKLRQFGELMVVKIFKKEKMKLPEDVNGHNQINRLKLLEKKGSIEGDNLDIFHRIRMAGNEAVHGLAGGKEMASKLIDEAHNLAVWFVQKYDNWEFMPEP